MSLAAVPGDRSALTKLGPALWYLALTLALSWPLALHPRSQVIGRGDVESSVWSVWHASAALRGEDGFFETRLLYHPRGSSLRLHFVQPLMGVLVAPLQAAGPALAYNAACLLGFVLTGLAMHALARGVGLPRSAALFAGTLYVVAPIHVAGLAAGHFHKVLYAPLPLLVLAVLRAARPGRSIALLGPGAVLLLAVLHAGDQIVLGGVAALVVGGAAVLAAGHGERGATLLRLLAAASLALLLVSPILALTLRDAGEPERDVNLSAEAVRQQPDLLRLVVPAAATSRFVGGALERWLPEDLRWLVRDAHSERAVFVPWTVLLLALRVPGSGRYLTLGLLGALLALGPRLQVLGATDLGPGHTALPLPFAALVQLPALGFLRTPGRFMAIALIGLGIAAAQELARLAQRWPRAAWVAILMVLVECWPRPLPAAALPAPSAFAQGQRPLADRSGVLDLPVRPARELRYETAFTTWSSRAMIGQIAHGRPIASGHLSRLFHVHPVLPALLSDTTDGAELPDVVVDGRPARRFANAGRELARHGFGQLLVHTDEMQDGWARHTTDALLREAAPSAPVWQEPGLDVYTVEPGCAEPACYEPTLVPLETTLLSWSRWKTGWRRLVPPASLLLASPRAGQARLELTAEAIEDAASGARIGEALLTLQAADGSQAVALLHPGQPLSLGLPVTAGQQAIELRLPEGLQIVLRRLEMWSPR
jgi:hypothetical protein